MGRLDVNTTGLLILTNDGELGYMINLKDNVAKTYLAKVRLPLDKPPSSEQLQRLKDGVEFSAEAGGVGRMLEAEVVGEPEPLPLLKPELQGKVKEKGTFTIRVVIGEGRYHIVKRMLSKVGLTVYTLHRHSVGVLSMDDLPELKQPGDVVRLSDELMARLWGSVGGQARLTRLKLSHLLCRYRYCLDHDNPVSRNGWGGVSDVYRVGGESYQTA